MEFSEACEKVVKIIQKDEEVFIETYTLLLQNFITALEDDETPAMALALAKEAIKDDNN